MTDETDDVSRSSRRRVLGAAAGGAGLLIGAVSGAVGGRSFAKAPDIPVYPKGRRFAGKVVVITGATSGIGAAAARMFAAEGGHVVFCGRRIERGRQVEDAIRKDGGSARYIQADVREENQVKAFIDAAAEQSGGIDVCFNNAGITIQKPLHAYTAAEWDDVQNTNLRGNFFALKYQYPWLKKRGGGVVVVTASSNAIATDAGRSAYTSSKRGLVGLVQSAAQDYWDDSIRINTLIPGTTNTELVRRAAGMMDAPDSVWDAAAGVWGRSNVAVARRMASPDEIAVMALALASEEYSYLTGAQIVIDGGKTTHA